MPDEERGAALRRRLLDAALRLVEEAGGLAVTADTLALDAVVREAGVARTSVYREWSGREAFYVDLLRELAGPGWQGPSPYDEDAVLLARRVVAGRLRDLGTAEGRSAVLEELVRRAALVDYQGLVRSVQWRSWVAVVAAVQHLPRAADRVRVERVLRASEAALVEHMAAMWAGLGVVLGRRLRPHVRGWATVATAAASVVEGFGVRRLLSPDSSDRVVVVDGPDGPQEWHLVALTMLSVVEGLTEPVPDYDPDVALADYLVHLAEREAVR
ncbi:TetR/AcrR family transcriptional regulator [Cellulomonas marina]|uniref:DNA-binding transcriptional regulator, AcrR family n=1 Tax=Cellulomonas marina TaxID=988821 RepID=A0A1I0X7K0_9CELL|nr:TetR/AcrR family transcriptional regulator [Cellulomonas marina]GIG28970.1 hypothetical protein Cma02nite_15700 [Cellulomonas marina]SFA96308.1 DNA-binding transcriptional regulator, AcrR family [Cellulomonas marina]